jgi:hypothetical protein
MLSKTMLGNKIEESLKKYLNPGDEYNEEGKS